MFSSKHFLFEYYEFKNPQTQYTEPEFESPWKRRLKSAAKYAAYGAGLAAAGYGLKKGYDSLSSGFHYTPNEETDVQNKTETYHNKQVLAAKENLEKEKAAAGTINPKSFWDYFSTKETNPDAVEQQQNIPNRTFGVEQAEKQYTTAVANKYKNTNNQRFDNFH